jgi:hypothetical protein
VAKGHALSSALLIFYLFLTLPTCAHFYGVFRDFYHQGARSPRIF